MSGIIDLAAQVFEKQERLRILSMQNTPIDHEERKKAFIAMELARYELNQAQDALRSLNPYLGIQS